jgi:HPt (histidine-containing phosphotransfer) domain-containing protein
MTDRRRVHALVVSGTVDPALGLDTVEVPSLEAALAQLGEPGTFDIVLLGASAAPLEALTALQRKAPDVPVVVLSRVVTDHVRVAIETATRNPRTASANARRVAALLPSYLSRRAQDVELLGEALERKDFESIARTGHNLRGNGVSFGFPELSAIGEALETSARSASTDEVREAIARLGECVR